MYTSTVQRNGNGNIGSTMPIQEELTETIEHGRDDLVRLLAERQIVPAVVDSGGSNLPGMSSAPTFRLDSEAGTSNVVDRQTTSKVVETLELESEEDCEAVCEEIRNHAAWGEA